MLINDKSAEELNVVSFNYEVGYTEIDTSAVWIPNANSFRIVNQKQGYTPLTLTAIISAPTKSRFMSYEAQLMQQLVNCRITFDDRENEGIYDGFLIDKQIERKGVCLWAVTYSLQGHRAPNVGTTTERFGKTTSGGYKPISLILNPASPYELTANPVGNALHIPITVAFRTTTSGSFAFVVNGVECTFENLSSDTLYRLDGTRGLFVSTGGSSKIENMTSYELPYLYPANDKRLPNTVYISNNGCDCATFDISFKGGYM